MMKDFVVDGEQVEAASRLGASAVLLIQGVFDRHLAAGRDVLIEKAHRLGLEVVLESSSLDELERALVSRADVLAYNRRDLRTFRPGQDLMAQALELVRSDGRPALAMSMLDSAEDVRKMRELGASGVLIGSALSGSPCPKEKLLSLRMPR
jgi:indole-3-glycerol phosphate synthase